ncbi:hypothetical protein HK405_005112, partial [Cladochytrium tenue]
MPPSSPTPPPPGVAPGRLATGAGAVAAAANERADILTSPAARELIQCSAATRIRRPDLFMLFALWMERFPRVPPHPPPSTPWALSPSPSPGLIDRTTASPVPHGLSTPPPLRRLDGATAAPPSLSPAAAFSPGGGAGATADEDDAERPHHRGTSYRALPTGAVLVDARDRVVALEATGEAHAVVRCILSAVTPELQGCDLYVSRYPCSLCVKMAVQAGVRKIFYFPAARWELAAPPPPPPASGLAATSLPPTALALEDERRELNRRSVTRLISNNPIAMTLFVPQWDHGKIRPSDLGENEDDDDFSADDSDAMPDDAGLSGGSGHPARGATGAFEPHITWELDEAAGQAPGIASRWATIRQKFRRTCVALSLLDLRYGGEVRCWTAAATTTTVAEPDEAEPPAWARHAMVLAHIAARRTDDPKLGVGSVLVDEGRYIS